MDLFGVIGKPIMHSCSPQLHNAAFEAIGVRARYLRIASKDASSALDSARSIGVKGVNVTAPYKEAVARMAAHRDPVVDVLGAANTLLWRDEQWHAFNTDVAGVQGALNRHRNALLGAEAVVLGAGGAALAAALALHQAGAVVTVAARRRDRARSIAQRVGCASCSLQDADAAVAGARVIVSAVSTAERVVDPSALRAGTIILDARYQSEGDLIREARERGCEIVDGREWLLCQAQQAFELFTGQSSPPGAMRSALSGERRQRGRMLSLVGFMGCGKTSVARILGKRLGMPSIDTDGLVERRTGVPVDVLLRERGEPSLREQECQALEALADDAGVLACGGGLVTIPRATGILRKRSRMVVWLWASAGTCLQRIGDCTTRPLLAPQPERIAPPLLQERIGAYASACDVVVDTEGTTPEAVAELVATLWSECT